MAKAARNAIRALIAVLIVLAYRPVLEQVILEVGRPGLPDDARGDRIIGLWLASIAGLLLYALFAPWVAGRLLVGLVTLAPVVLAGLGFAFFAAVGGPDARTGAPPLVIAAVLLGTVLATVPTLGWLYLEWVTRSHPSPGARKAWILAGGLLVLGLAAASQDAWQVRRARQEAFERVRRSVVQPPAPSPGTAPAP